MSRGRVLLVAVCMWLAYQMVQWPSVRAIYSAEDKWAHGLAFFTVWWAMRWATTWRPWTLVMVSAALGGAVEIHQMYLPGFSPSWADWLADLAGIAVALMVFAWNQRLRRRRANAPDR